MMLLNHDGNRFDLRDRRPRQSIPRIARRRAAQGSILHQADRDRRRQEQVLLVAVIEEIERRANLGDFAIRVSERLKPLPLRGNRER